MVNSNTAEEEEVNIIKYKRTKCQIKLMGGKHFKIRRAYQRMDMYVIDVINQGISNNIVQQIMTQIITNHALKAYLKNSNGNK